MKRATRSASASRQGAAMTWTPSGSAPGRCTGTATTGRPMNEIGWVKRPILGRVGISTPAIGQQTFVLDGVELPVRPNIGIYTQPISFIGLPVVAVPMLPMPPMPIGVQVIAPPWREDIALRIAYALEQTGVCVAPRPAQFASSS